MSRGYPLTFSQETILRRGHHDGKTKIIGINGNNLVIELVKTKRILVMDTYGRMKKAGDDVKHRIERRRNELAERQMRSGFS